MLGTAVRSQLFFLSEKTASDSSLTHLGFRLQVVVTLLVVFNSVVLIKPGKLQRSCSPWDATSHSSFKVGNANPPLLFTCLEFSTPSSSLLFRSVWSPNHHLLLALSGVLHRHLRSAFLPNPIPQSGKGVGGMGWDGGGGGVGGQTLPL